MEFPFDVIEQCERFANYQQDVVDWKLAECLFAALMGVPPNFGPSNVITIGRTRVIVRHTLPLTLPDGQDEGSFDVLALMRLSVERSVGGEVLAASGECAGWIGKAEYLRRQGKPILTSHRIGVFPGRSDDPREHYCYCGEWGSFGRKGRLPEWTCRAHNV